MGMIFILRKLEFAFPIQKTVGEYVLESGD